MDKQNLEILNRYAINLNEKAKQGKLDPVLGVMMRCAEYCRSSVEELKTILYS